MANPEPGESKVAFGGISDVGLSIVDMDSAIDANKDAYASRYISVTMAVRCSYCVIGASFQLSSFH